LEKKRVDVYYHSSKNSGGVVEPCGWCKGSGTAKDYLTGSERKCDVCLGKGKNRFSGATEICPRCNGTGTRKTLIMNAPRKCDVCQGRGYNEI
jgi:hypothetical protein